MNGILLGLAPDEVYHAAPVTKSAVSSYLAISPLPRRAETLRGGLLSVALSVVFPRLDVIQHPALRCPDFPPALLPAAIRHPKVKYRKLPLKIKGRTIP